MDDETLNPSDPGDLSDAGDADVARRLEAFAAARLSPSADATTRMRAGVMTAAHRRAALIEGAVSAAVPSAAAPSAAAPAAPAAPSAAALAAAAPAVAPSAAAPSAAAPSAEVALAARNAETARSAWRRPVAAVMAGIVTIGILGGAAFSTRAGGPLYEARIWTEMANLPADRPARALAQVARLDQRLQEAQGASTDGDGHATEVALIAYSTIVVDAGTGTAGDPTAVTTIKVTVTRHIVVLRLLVDSVPAPARTAVQQALSSSTMVLDDLGGTGSIAGVDQRKRSH